MAQPTKSVLLIISGGIAAYKSLELIRLFKKDGIGVQTILTKSGAEFVTPLSIQALSGNKVYQDLWDLTAESEMGHIELSRAADLILVAPATANILAKMTHGIADDLATTCLLATNKPVIAAPAMNVKMWENAATQDNIATLKKRGIDIIQPEEGDMACGEYGEGRLPDPETIFSIVKKKLNPETLPLHGKIAFVTAGPTYEAIDPVRFIGNHSSGKQGYAIAEALRDAGAEVTLISGPTRLQDPHGVKTVHVTSAQEMLDASLERIDSDIAICTAAVSDWRSTEPADQKIKKQTGADAPTLVLTENPDILATISKHKSRPALVIGFAAETQEAEKNAKEKLLKKGCDWIIANEISITNPVFGQDTNTAALITRNGVEESWKTQTKVDIARKIVEKTALFFYQGSTADTSWQDNKERA
ncbi:MAG: bifunctional phosphopantothenoylcysteine decarboxylase/phosphopantothenate--cysteine ligase CoaBC [Micavibrio sp.]|nr:bifunctional phosphopantothenoylcysteine decarboxylase/phosphopantothenate--cysteine ligase CoaBC [Micavibrio sp.]